MEPPRRNGTAPAIGPVRDSGLRLDARRHFPIGEPDAEPTPASVERDMVEALLGFPIASD